MDRCADWQIHHDKHHQAYVDNLNKTVASEPSLAGKPVEELLANLDSVPQTVRTAIRNQAGGHANHSLFSQTLTPASKQKKPSGRPASLPLHVAESGFDALYGE